ncbi:hypothetical protein HAX54_026979 [Datura stramonium]|uniref:Uncharacterized protein n=1 Tax=Datura stramonium TaxID=4076 RepID=A0ABS8S8E4_DATST|nr:hypothetical protein [Datura stramonium]
MDSFNPLQQSFIKIPNHVSLIQNISFPEELQHIGTKQRRRRNGERKETRAVLCGAKAAGSGVEYSSKGPRTSRELQIATRTIQTLSSEAKGMKQTTITSKIPITKRSMERFLFRVKELLPSNSNGCTSCMGNLKHKNLMGDVSKLPSICA